MGNLINKHVMNNFLPEGYREFGSFPNMYILLFVPTLACSSNLRLVTLLVIVPKKPPESLHQQCGGIRYWISRICLGGIVPLTGNIKALVWPPDVNAIQYGSPLNRR